MNKKAFAPLVIYGSLLIIIGLIGYSIWQSTQVKGLSQKEMQDEIAKAVAEAKASGNAQTPTEIRDNIPSTPSPEATHDNTPTVPKPTICTLSGKWTTLWVKEKTSIDTSAKYGAFYGAPKLKAVGIFLYTGTCVSDVYLEAGIVPQSKQPLSLLPITRGIPSKASWCDGNRNYYGHLFKDVNPGQKLVQVDFSPETPKEEGTYDMVVVAATGCAAKITTDEPISIGEAITINKFKIKVSDSYSEDIGGSATNSWVHVIG